ncbi:hypothetical protein TNCV_1190391 [Trichonephila clavipes]|nr:hypothetical protein TNCV_1190391 [Trichonephila clavipes]
MWNCPKNSIRGCRLKNFIDTHDLTIAYPDPPTRKIDLFTSAVRSTHQLASKPIDNKKHPYTPNHIHELIREKNRAKKLFHETLNPAHKTLYYRLQEKLKKELKKHTQQTWKNKLGSLNTLDNSSWQCQEFFRKKRSNIPSLFSSGVANSDEQKANILVLTLKENFAENKRPGDGSNPIDKEITNTLEDFSLLPLLSPFPPPIRMKLTITSDI